jgi:hypothetical protein
MMEERYHATTQNRFYPDMSNVNKSITVEANLSAHLRTSGQSDVPARLQFEDIRFHDSDLGAGVAKSM